MSGVDGLCIEGSVLTKGTPEYESTRTSNFAQNSHDRDRAFPRHIAIVETVKDIQKCVQFASEQGLAVNVRSGGHNWFGCFLRDDAVLIDMRKFNDIELDLEARTARLGPCVPGTILNKECEKHGLCFSTGHCDGVQVGGFLLGGGFGWFSPFYGFAAESLLSLTLVDAKGNIVEVTEDQEEWMWLARGSASMFPGVVTSFQVRLHVKPPIIRTRMDFYDVEEYEKIMETYISYTNAKPEESRKLELGTSLACTPPMLAEVLHAPKILMVFASCIADSEEEFLSLSEYLGRMPEPICKGKGWEDSTFSALSEGMSAAYPPGLRWISRSSIVDIDQVKSLEWKAIRDTFMDKAPLGLSQAMAVVTPRCSVDKPGAYGAYCSPGIIFLYYGVHAPGDDAGPSQEYVDAMSRITDAHVWRFNPLEHPLNKDTFDKCFPEAEKLVALRSKYDPAGVFFDPSKAMPSH